MDQNGATRINQLSKRVQEIEDPEKRAAEEAKLRARLGKFLKGRAHKGNRGFPR